MRQKTFVVSGEEFELAGLMICDQHREVRAADINVPELQLELAFDRSSFLHSGEE